MALEDLTLERPPSDGLMSVEPPPPRGPSPLRWVAVGLAGVAAGAVLMFCG